jgi:hypothetical protein
MKAYSVTSPIDELVDLLYCIRKKETERCNSGRSYVLYPSSVDQITVVALLALDRLTARVDCHRSPWWRVKLGLPAPQRIAPAYIAPVYIQWRARQEMDDVIACLREPRWRALAVRALRDDFDVVLSLVDAAVSALSELSRVMEEQGVVRFYRQPSWPSEEEEEWIRFRNTA